MRQTFFHELHELEKREKREKKEKIQLYLRKQGVTLRDFLSWFFISIAVFFSVVMAIYAMYLFIDVTKISDIADINVTKNIKLVARTIQGNTFNDPEAGVYNWILHRDLKNGFEIAHPEDWIAGKGSGHLFEIKKYNSQKSANESLAAIIYIDKLENANGLSLLELVTEETGLEEDILKKETINGKDLVRTDKQKDASGLMYSKIFWQRDGNNYCLNVVYYNQNNLDAENDLKKILFELKIL